MRIVLGGILSFLMVVLSAWSFHDLADKNRLAASGKESEGVITAITESRAHRGGPSHYVEYRYPTKYGEMRGTVEISEETSRQLHAGMPVKVRFEPRSPDRHVSVPYGLDAARQPWSYAFMLGLTALCIGWTWRQLRRHGGTKDVPVDRDGARAS